MRKEAILSFQKSPLRFGTFIKSFFSSSPSVWGVEIGVHRAFHAKMMFDSHSGLNFIGVDLWEKHFQQSTSYLDSSGQLPGRFRDEDLAKAWHREAERVLSPYSTHATLFCESSIDNARRWENGFFDFVYIDADHSYKACMDDLKAWFPKVRKGGIIAGHDYGCGGVHQALLEFFQFEENVRPNSAEELKGRCWLHEKISSH